MNIMIESSIINPLTIVMSEKFHNRIKEMVCWLIHLLAGRCGGGNAMIKWTVSNIREAVR